MFDKKSARLLFLIVLLLSSSLLAGCGEPKAQPQATETAQLAATQTPQPQATQTPETTTFTSPLAAPTASPAFVLTPPLTPMPTQTPDPARTPVAIVNAEIGPDREVVTIQNISAVEQDISGWILFNLVGDPTFNFPDNLVLQPGQSVQVYSAVPQDQVPRGAFFWTEEKVWNEFPANVLLLNRITRLMYWYVSNGNQ